MIRKDSIASAFENGKKYKATHMIIFRNVYDDETLIRFIDKNNNPEEEIKNMFKLKNGYIVDGVYSYELDIKEQLKEDYPYHIDTKSIYKEIYDKALDYATKKHEGTFRKGKIVKPYITHPIEVSKLVSMYMYKNPEVEIFKAAALLHDTIEDTDATYEEVKEIFGKRIADIVIAVTNDKELKKELGKDRYLAEKMNDMKDDILTLKLCDRLQNIDESRNADDEFRKKYQRETTYIINFLLFNRTLTDVNLRLISDIMRMVKEVSIGNPMPLKSVKELKMTLENPTC